MLYRAVVLSEGLTRKDPLPSTLSVEWRPEFLKGLQARKAPVAWSLEGPLPCLRVASDMALGF